jgi:hypothetical protein
MMVILTRLQVEYSFEVLSRCPTCLRGKAKKGKLAYTRKLIVTGVPLLLKRSSFEFTKMYNLRVKRTL